MHARTHPFKSIRNCLLLSSFLRWQQRLSKITWINSPVATMRWGQKMLLLFFSLPEWASNMKTFRDLSFEFIHLQLFFLAKPTAIDCIISSGVIIIRYFLLLTLHEIYLCLRAFFIGSFFFLFLSIHLFRVCCGGRLSWPKMK